MKDHRLDRMYSKTRLALVKKQFSTYITKYRYWLFPVVLFGLAVASSTELAFSYVEAKQNLGSRYPIVAFQWFLSIIGGFTAIFAGYASVTADRNTGRLPLILKLPYSRNEYLLQKFLGHASALSALLLLVLSCGFLVCSFVLGPPPILAALAFIAVSVLYILVWLSLAMTVSMLVKTGRRAVAVLIPVFIGTGMLWRMTFTSILTPIFGEIPQTISLLITRLVPFRAYLVATNWLTGLPNSHSYGTSVGQDLNAEFVSYSTIVPLELSNGVPWYLNEWLTIPILLFWLVVPPLVATRRFNAVDLV
ncbi:ABC transporter permease [Halostagnicola larsenii]|nr:ABC transporter permease subunit [Halostagnicola larsenii]